ncbi:MAG: hypothetical protein HGA65_11215, partial [Oscillochloris sp.]|nr:hypothetical protein [Oscillochloris sp.]
VRQQIDSSLADIKVGERVIATGTQSGDTFTASSIQAGVSFGGSNAPGGAAPSGNTPAGTPPNGNPPSGAPNP